jgi:hypothetical protein
VREPEWPAEHHYQWYGFLVMQTNSMTRSDSLPSTVCQRLCPQSEQQNRAMSRPL